MAEEAPITPAPGPWTLKGTVYLASFWNKAGNLPSHAYSPLEASSPYADPSSSGKHVGGISMYQIIRYSESPVGPYDELIVCPGFYEYDIEDKNGKRKTKKAARISRIYVSQKYTCWNGRKNWNIPKHLASFDFDEKPDGSMHVKVFPHETPTSKNYDATESKPQETPFFQASFQPQRFIPSFPLNLDWAKYIGIQFTLVQPPLPENPEAAKGELPGTDRWCAIVPGQSSPRATVGWMDVSQKDKDGKGKVVTSGGEAGGAENFWPGQGRWLMGCKMERTLIDFPEGVHWDAPGTKL